MGYASTQIDTKGREVEVDGEIISIWECCNCE